MRAGSVFMSSIGTISGPMRYKGVSIKDLLDTVGGLNDDEAIRISGTDGYSMTLSNLQANGEGLIAFDGISGEEVTPPQLTLIAAYEENGQPIEEKIARCAWASSAMKARLQRGTGG